MRDQTYERGYADAVASQLAGMQRQLNGHADHVPAEAAPTARRALRMAADHTGKAEELLTSLSASGNPALNDRQRAHAEAKLSDLTAAPLRPLGETPTERGELAGEEVVLWLDDLIPAWPDDHTVAMSGHLVQGPRTGGTAIDFTHVAFSTTMPIGALITALKAVAEQGGPAAQTIWTVLTEHGVPEAAAYQVRDRALNAELDARRG